MSHNHNSPFQHPHGPHHNHHNHNHPHIPAQPEIIVHDNKHATILIPSQYGVLKFNIEITGLDLKLTTLDPKTITAIAGSNGEIFIKQNYLN